MFRQKVDHLPLAEVLRQHHLRLRGEEAGKLRLFRRRGRALAQGLHEFPGRPGQGQTVGERLPQGDGVRLLRDRHRLIAAGSEELDNLLDVRGPIARPDPERVARPVVQPAPGDADDEVPGLFAVPGRLRSRDSVTRAGKGFSLL